VFIQVIQGKCTDQDKLHELTEKWGREVAPGSIGWLGGTYGITDDGQFVGVIRFEDREKAMQNSARPEQSAWWSEVERCFEGPVTFHDAEKVMLMMGGGSDDAEFVQVIQGKVDDPTLLESHLDRMSAVLHDARPEILGATIALEPDGTFTETVAFTNEAAAREGERHEMPYQGEAADLLKEFDSITHDLSYYDLHQPWFATPGAAGR
jgi:hypothetical protein